MTDEEFYERNDVVKQKVLFKAAEVSARLNLALKIDVPEAICGLPRRVCDRYLRLKEGLSDTHKDKLPSLIAYSVFVMWNSCIEGALWFKYSIESGTIGDNDYCQVQSTPEGYAEYNGWSSTAYDKLSELIFEDKMRPTARRHGFEPPPSSEDVLHGLELYWLFRASARSTPDQEKLAAIFEAGEAARLANGLYMWEASEKIALETMADPGHEAAKITRRIQAKAAASARHANSQTAKAQVIQRYREERANYATKDQAAMAFTRDYPFEFGTIREWLKGV